MIIIHYVKDYHKRSERQAVLIPKYDSDPYFRVMFLGRVGLGFQPEPSRRQVPKTQAPLRVLVVAGGHAAPWFEAAEAPCHGLARRVPFRVVGLGVQAPAPGGKDGLHIPWRPLGTEAVAVISPVRDQAGQGRVGPGFY